MDHPTSSANNPDVNPFGEELEKTRKLIEQISVSPKVNTMGEEMRNDILAEINRRINFISRKVFWIKTAAAAASVVILLGITNYFSYQRGYRQQNGQLVETFNPLGLRSTIQLSDGTKVTMNAGTVLKYPTAFESGSREVELTGEAFFDVAHDEKRLFTVKTENMRVRVYGTKFNVKSYQDENNTEVTLAEGSVGIALDNRSEIIEMTPKEQVVFNKTNRKIEKRVVIVDQYTAWREGKYYFRNASLEDIVKQLERNFSMHIVIDSEKLKKTNFTGDFVRGENLEQMLRVMSIDKRIYYQIEDNIIHIREYQ